MSSKDGSNNSASNWRRANRRREGRDFRFAPLPFRSTKSGNVLQPLLQRRSKYSTEDALRRAEKVARGEWCGQDRFINRSKFNEEISDIGLGFEMAEIVRAQDITKEMIVEGIADIAFRSDEGEKPIHPAVRLKALDLLAKWVGLYEKDNAQKLAGTSLLQIAFVGADRVDLREAQMKQVEGVEVSSKPSKALKVLEKDIKDKITEVASAVSDAEDK